jgi:hypothetical protein
VQIAPFAARYRRNFFAVPAKFSRRIAEDGRDWIVDEILLQPLQPHLLQTQNRHRRPGRPAFDGLEKRSRIFSDFARVHPRKPFTGLDNGLTQ